MTPEQFRTRCTERLARSIPPHGAQALADRLGRFVASESHSERVDTFVELTTWIRLGQSGQTLDVTYLEAIVRLLEEEPEIGGRTREAFGSLTSNLRSVRLFSETGIPSERGFLAELWERMLGLVIPQPREDTEADRVFERLYGSRRSVERFRSLPPELFARLVAVITAPKNRSTAASKRSTYADAFRLLAVRASSQGLSNKFRSRGHATSVTGSPFYKLIDASEELVTAFTKNRDMDEPLASWQKVISGCRSEMAKISGRLETDGVSVDIVYGLEVLSICLKRMERMAAIMAPDEESAGIEELHQLLANLVDAAHRDQSISELLRTNTSLLIRKIVDRSGESGEHYVAESRADYKHILLAAAGGGLLTVMTAALKLVVTHTHLPLFVVGLLAGINYSVSFLMLQAFGLILATKQPSMTAATLAKIVREERGETRETEIVDFAARICSSQLAAAAANVLFVFAGATVFDTIWTLTRGRTFLDGAESRYVLEGLTPFASGTVFYAALTGVILYLGSVAGGWFDNWAVFHRIPQAIRESAFSRIFGTERMARVSRAARRNFAGIGTNVALGMMLGLAPVFGTFFGLPLDVRHVTLSTGTLAFAASAVPDPEGATILILRAFLGIASMFVLNLSVAFLLSLSAAVRAYKVAPEDVHSISRALMRRMLTRPRDFVLPPAR